MRSSYSDGKIYCYLDRVNSRVYIGSTCQKAMKRIQDHQTDFKGYMGLLQKERNYRSSFDIIIQDKYEVHILENFKCENKEQLEDRETQWILAFKQKDFEVVNKNKPNKDTKLILPHYYYPIPRSEMAYLLYNGLEQCS